MVFAVQFPSDDGIVINIFDVGSVKEKEISEKEISRRKENKFIQPIMSRERK